MADDLSDNDSIQISPWRLELIPYRLPAQPHASIGHSVLLLIETPCLGCMQVPDEL